jgi:hypothetical protein
MSFVKRMIKKHFSWTVSKLGVYKNCPAQAKYKFIDKLFEPEAPPLVRGTEIHNAAEQYVTGREKKLHADLKLPVVKNLLNQLRKEYKKKKVRVELELAFTKEWKPCHWMSKEVYVRFKIDVVHFLTNGEALVIDWKTGKFKPGNAEYGEQLEGYCLGLLASGLAKKVRSQLVFTDSGDVVEVEKTYTLKDLPQLQKRWDNNARPFLSDTKHAPKPGNACKYCNFSTNKGGPCEF